MLRVDVDASEALTLVAVDGEVDIASADRLLDAARLAGAGQTPVVIDLSRVGFMDSSGLRALLDLAGNVTNSGRPFALLRPSAAVTRLLDLVDLRHRFVEIQDVDHESISALK